MQTIKIKYWDELPKDYTGIIENTIGDKAWFLNGKYHREDGPAVEYANGDKFWYLNGKPHRVDGPAAEYTNGDKFWYLNGKYFPSRESWQRELDRELDKFKPTCNNKVVEIDGKKYKLVLTEG